MSHINRLQRLLLSLSDGTWEHGEGLVIENLDNPGWSIRLCLSGTRYEELVVNAVSEDRSDSDWIFCRAVDQGHDRLLEINCAPANLEEALGLLFACLEME